MQQLIEKSKEMSNINIMTLDSQIEAIPTNEQVKKESTDITASDI